MNQDVVLQLSLEQFLCEADGPEVAPWNVQSFDDYVDDIDRQIAPGTEVLLRDGYSLAQSADAALLLHEGELVGYYMPPGAVCLMEEHQGQGMGAELILYTALYFSGGPPTEGLDEQCFSEAGWYAHIAAWKLGVERGLIIDPGRRPTP